jgi:DNA repair protein RAD50
VRVLFIPVYLPPDGHRYTKALDAIKALRKDRVAELKAEQERLNSLSREKDHSDKLVKRVSDLNSTITTKELEYEEVKREYDELVKANKKFYEQGTKFREMYLKLETLQEKKSRHEEDLASAKENLQVISGSVRRGAFLSRLTLRHHRHRRGDHATSE